MSAPQSSPPAAGDETRTDASSEAATEVSAAGSSGAGVDAAAAASTPLVARVIRWALSLKAVRAYLRYSERNGAMLADSVTYRALFSVFAGVLLGFTIAGFWISGDPEAIAALGRAINSAVPGLVGRDGLIKLDELKISAGLSIAGAISLLGLVGAAIGAIGSLRTAMRTVTDAPATDTFFVWVILRNLALAVILGVGLAASAVVTVVGTAFAGTVASWFGASPESGLAGCFAWLVALVVTFTLDAVVIAVAYVLLAGVPARGWALWSGALIGATGLIVLQQLSGLFVGGAKSNPLLASFAALIALLLWFNLSSQVILIATSWIVTGVNERRDRVHEKYGAPTFPERAVRTAEAKVALAAHDLARARAALPGAGSAGADSDSGGGAGAGSAERDDDRMPAAEASRH